MEDCRNEAKSRITEPAEVNKSAEEKRKMFARISSSTHKRNREKRSDKTAQNLSADLKHERETPCIYVHRRKNPAVRATRTTVTPDLVTVAAPFPDRLEAALVPVGVGEGTMVLVLVLVTPEGLAGSEP